MKIGMILKILTSLFVGFIFLQIARAATVDPQTVLQEVKTSVNSSLDDKLRVLLALGVYHTELKEKAEADAVYTQILGLIHDTSTRELAANATFLMQLSNKFDESTDELTRRRGAELRTSVIQRTLNEAPSKEVQNATMNAFGAGEVYTLAIELSAAPEFKDIFKATLKGFPLDKDPEKILASYNDAVRFAKRVGDPGLRNILLIHVIEKFAEQGDPQLHFSEKVPTEQPPSN